MSEETLGEGITKIESGVHGPTIAVFAGVHGNEKAGVMALQEALPVLEEEVVKGTFYGVFANPPAVEQNVRAVNKNLNRCFVKGTDGSTYEDKRAKKLMSLLDKCDALLDLHAFRDEVSPPFIICEEDSLDIAQQLPPEIISTNWSDAEPGATDAYMFENGKPAICLECGPITQSEVYKDFARQSIYSFLSYFGVIEKSKTQQDIVAPKKIIRAEYGVVNESGDCLINGELESFKKLEKGQFIGAQADKVYLANEGEVIIFPRPNAAIGEEIFIVGKEISDEQNTPS